MGIYPRKDCAIRLCLVDNSQLEGLVNIVGRDLKTFLLDSETDIVMYEAVGSDEEGRRPMIVRKSQILWVEVKDHHLEEPRSATLRHMKMKLGNGQLVSGEIDITGYDRISDYFQKNSDIFAEISRATLDGEKSCPVMYVSATRYIWVIPDNEA